MPQGALTDALGYRIESEPITNLKSVLGDHTAYWANEPEFVRRVVSELDQDAILGLTESEPQRLLGEASAHHRRAVNLLAWTRRACAAALLVGLLTAWDLFAETGRRVVGFLADGPLQSLGVLVLRIGGMAEWLVKTLIGTVPAGFATVGYVVVATALFAGATILWRLCFFPLWRWWDRAVLIDVARRTDTFGLYGTWFVWPPLTVLAAFPAVLLLLYVRDALRTLEWAAYLAGAVLVASVGTIILGVSLATGVLDAARNWPARVATLRHALAAAVDPAHSWSALFGAILAYFVAVVMPLFLGATYLEKWLGAGHWIVGVAGAGSLLTIFAWFAWMATLLEARLFRLARGCGRGARLAVVSLPFLIAGTVAIVLIPHGTPSAVLGLSMFVFLIVVVVDYAIIAVLLRRHAGHVQAAVRPPSV